MKRANEKSEIGDVIAEQRNRGRKHPSDTETDRERKRFRNDIAKLFEAGDERGFILALQRARIPEPQFSNALRVWRELQATHSQTGGRP
jgi:hypothetical protein